MTMPSVAGAIGVSPSVIEGVEDHDELGQLTLDQITTLEDLLGIDLVTTTQEDVESRAGDVCGAVAQAADGLSLDEIAMRLGLPPEEILKVIRTARRGLNKLGLTLSQSRGHVRLIPHGIDARERSHPLTPTLDELDDDDLEILLDVEAATRNDPFCYTKHFSRADQERIGRLIQIGALMAERGGVSLSPLLRDSLVTLKLRRVPYRGFQLRRGDDLGK